MHAQRKNQETRQGARPLDPLRTLRFDAEGGGIVCLNETSDRQKSGGRIAEGKRTSCFGLRVMADGLFGLNSNYMDGHCKG